MSTKVVILLSLLILYSSLQAQDKTLLKKYVHRQFNVLPHLVFSNDFYDIQSANFETDDFSYARIDELKDSFETYLDESYLYRIYIIYDGLNDVESGKKYLRELAVRFQDKQIDEPDNIKILRNLCQIHLLLRDIYPAMEFADRILDYDPRDQIALMTNAMLHFGSGDFSVANDYAERGIKAFPESPVFYILKTTLLLSSELVDIKNKDVWEGFSADFSYLLEAEDKYKNNAELQFNLLHCNLFVLYLNVTMPYFLNPPESFHKFRLSVSDSLKLHDYEFRLLSMAKMDKFKNNHSLYFYVGFINLLQGEYNTAIEYFTQSIDAYGSQRVNKEKILVSYNNILSCYLLMGDTIQAQKWTERKINDKVSTQSLPQDYIELARYYLKKGQLNQGENLLQKAIELDSTTFEAFVELANIEMINDNFKTAEELLDKCFKINPDCVEMYESAILLSLFQGDIGTAKYYVKRILVDDPENSFALDIERDFLNN
ncbi:tetratricopeptide repeat protein [Maribellus mangrovi]|uniref:tetratricopeptide repeat protein n=1 Tax=Maribellus mangrovi TaxID=3133146 RepID=UPI0030EECCA4